MLYELRPAAIKLFNEYSLIESEDKYKAKQGKGLKILSPKQMLLRIPIALAQVKSGNTYENLLNEIRKILYSLHREITKKQITIQQYNRIDKTEWIL